MSPARAPTARRKPHVLVISTQDLLPPTSGGVIRAFHLVEQMAKSCRCTVMQTSRCPDSEATRPYLERLAGVRIRSSDEPAARPGRLNIPGRVRRKWWRIRLRRIMEPWRGDPLQQWYGPLYHWYPVLGPFLRDDPPDVAVMEHVWHVETFAFLRRLCPGVRCVLNAYDIETVLRERCFGGGDAVSRMRLARVRRLESTLSRHVDEVWTCSAQDAAALRSMNGRQAPSMTVVPNGVDTRYWQFRPERNGAGVRQLVFVGTLDYRPNSDGIRWFVENVWPCLTGLRLIVAGRNPTRELREWLARDGRIELRADVPDVRPLLGAGAISICPLHAGSGTRLKILEAMSAGVPVVSTTQGAEGIDVTPGEHLLLADDPRGFAAMIERLVGDAALYERIRIAARRLVEHRYSWDRIGQVARSRVEAAAGQPSRGPAP